MTQPRVYFCPNFALFVYHFSLNMLGDLPFGSPGKLTFTSIERPFIQVLEKGVQELRNGFATFSDFNAGEKIDANTDDAPSATQKLWLVRPHDSCCPGRESVCLGLKKPYWYLNGSSLFLEIVTHKKGGIFPNHSRIDSSLCVHANAVACLGAPSTIKASQFNGPLSGPFSFLSHPKVTAWFPVIHFRLVSEETAGWWQEDGWRVCSVLSTRRSCYHSPL